MIWPLLTDPPTSVIADRDVGADRDGRRHAGVDVDAAPGDLVQAPFDGHMTVHGWEGAKGLHFVAAGKPTVVVGPVARLPGMALRTRAVRAGEPVAVVSRYSLAGRPHLHVEVWGGLYSPRARVDAVHAAERLGAVPAGIVHPLTPSLWTTSMATPPPANPPAFPWWALLAAIVVGLVVAAAALLLSRSASSASSASPASSGGRYGIGRLDDLDTAELRSLYRAIKNGPARNEWDREELMRRIDAAAASDPEAAARGDAWWLEA